MKADAPLKLLTVNDAASLLGMTPKALRCAIERGQVPGVVRLGRRVRINLAALERWVRTATGS